jgi:hypothetical protein
MNVKTTVGSAIAIRVLVSTVVVALAPVAWPQSGAPIWTNRFSSPGEADDIPCAVAVNNAGTVYVTGFSYGGTGNGDDDYLTLAYSSTGVPLWTNRYHGPANRLNYPVGIALGPNGNVVVAGYVTATNRWVDYATIAYSSAGVSLWTNCYEGPASRDDRATAMAVAGDGTVFVTGYSYGTNGFNEYATLAYSAAGEPLWTNRYGTGASSSTSPTALAVDTNGNVFVTGDTDYATIAYSSAGVPLWTNCYRAWNTLVNCARAIATDKSGNVFVTGRSRFYIGENDYATVAYSGAGVPLWTNRYNGPANLDDTALAIAVNSEGHVFVTGYSAATNGYEYATVAYSSTGLPLWTNRYRQPGDQFTYPAALAVDVSGNVFVTGYALANGAYEYATVAYSDAGMPLWTNRYNQDGYSSEATALAVDRVGNTVVTGYSDRLPVHGRDYLTIMHSSTVQFRLSVQQEENHLVLRWPSQNLLLQCAASLTGLFTNILGAASPYTNSMSSAQQYFRLSSP